MRVASLEKNPGIWVSRSGTGGDHTAQDGYVLAERDVDVGQHGFQLVQVETIELERRREHDLVAFEPVGCVKQRTGVQLEQLPVDRRGGLVVLRCRADR